MAQELSNNHQEPLNALDISDALVTEISRRQASKPLISTPYDTPHATKARKAVDELLSIELAC